MVFHALRQGVADKHQRLAGVWCDWQPGWSRLPCYFFRLKIFGPQPIAFLFFFRSECRDDIRCSIFLIAFLGVNMVGSLQKECRCGSEKQQAKSRDDCLHS